ncbi:hypothetical protein FRUB_01652 [Fimbriiglobus ruber]|uniref:Uncharacterized protein n=1 Tax=Fimbriiglobus ruber TaxID=1908690 RepID=A0A225DVD4_9BACT|nr:hypothetical protein FRUB_01652 [Fimbriiglobus ruber]
MKPACSSGVCENVTGSAVDEKSATTPEEDLSADLLRRSVVGGLTKGVSR